MANETKPSSLKARFRVVHLDAGREMRGGQWQALALHEGLLARGERSLLLAREESPLAKAARERALPMEPLSLGRVWREGRDAILHAHDAASHRMAAIAGARRLVVSRRVVFPVKRGFLSRWKYRRAALFLAVSEQVRGELLRAGVPMERIRVVYDGVEALPLPRERRDVVALDSDDPGKCGDLIRVAASLGGFPVSFHGDLPSAFAQAKIFVYLSRAEGLGSAALLAMSAGIPVVASRLPALAEIVEHRKTGLLVDNEAAAVAEAVRTLLSDDSLCESLGQAGRDAVEARFSVDHMVENTLAAYQSL
ncbi:MAG: glycosyltransferase family 4 protein [Bryobacterales bacterium]|nr:glycosyltransferase family 4 protein [Bryobacterales bacterium]